MTTALSEACTDLAAWLPVVGVLVAEPDITGGSESHAAPGSCPPWNPGAANAFYDAHAAVRRIEGHLRVHVTGTVRARGGSDAATLDAIDAIPRLAHAVDQELADDAARQLTRLLARILQLPAIDLEDRPLRPDAPCPRCTRKMLRYWPRSGEIACIGCLAKAVLTIGAVSGEPFLTWDDGEVTTAPNELEGAS